MPDRSASWTRNEFFFSSRRRHTRCYRDWSSDVCSSDLLICSPLGLFDCCPTTDGAAAAIVCRADLAKKWKKPPIWLKGVGLAVETGRPYFDPTFDYLGFRSTQKAAQAAYRMAQITPQDVDFAEVH